MKQYIIKSNQFEKNGIYYVTDTESEMDNLVGINGTIREDGEAEKFHQMIYEELQEQKMKKDSLSDYLFRNRRRFGYVHYYGYIYVYSGEYIVGCIPVNELEENYVKMIPFRAAFYSVFDIDEKYVGYIAEDETDIMEKIPVGFEAYITNPLNVSYEDVELLKETNDFKNRKFEEKVNYMIMSKGERPFENIHMKRMEGKNFLFLNDRIILDIC